jgi:hypothetical protein
MGWTKDGMVFKSQQRQECCPLYIIWTSFGVHPVPHTTATWGSLLGKNSDQSMKLTTHLQVVSLSETQLYTPPPPQMPP